MTKFDRWQTYERPQMVDKGETEEIYIARDAVAVLRPVPPIEDRKPQTWVKLKGGQDITVIGFVSDVALTMSGHFDE